MKRVWIVYFVMLMMAWPASAQPGHHFSPKQFRMEMEQYITREAYLTPLDAKNFFPIFNELHEKQRKLEREIKRLKREEIPHSVSDKEYAKIIEQIISLKIESAELEKKYYHRLCQKVSPKKVHAAMLAEDRFHRKMLFKMHKKARIRVPQK